MFARVVEVNIQPDKIETLKTLVANEVAPLVQKNPGFVDNLVLVDENAPNTMLNILLFKSKSDIEKYEREALPQIMQKIRPLLANDPKVTIHRVETSTFHRITAGMAA